MLQMVIVEAGWPAETSLLVVYLFFSIACVRCWELYSVFIDFWCAFAGVWGEAQVWDTDGLLQELWWIPHWFYGWCSFYSSLLSLSGDCGPFRTINDLPLMWWVIRGFVQWFISGKSAFIGLKKNLTKWTTHTHIHTHTPSELCETFFKSKTVSLKFVFWSALSVPTLKKTTSCVFCVPLKAACINIHDHFL